MRPLQPDTTLADGRYRLLEPLGKGGMAEVWCAWDQRLSVERAIKLLSDRYRRSSSAAVRFEREARVMAKLEHPHVVPVHDIGESDDGRVFLVMSLLDHSLQDELEEWGQLPAGRAVRMCIGVLDALAAAHDAGVVHRDVKPHNVLVACVVDLPPFSGTPPETGTPSPTGDTGPTTEASATTGETGGTAESTGATGTTSPTGDTGRPAPSCTFEAAAAGASVFSPLATLDDFQLHAYAAPMPGAGPAGEDVLWYVARNNRLTRRHLEAGLPNTLEAGQLPGIRQLRATGDRLVALHGTYPTRDISVLDGAGVPESTFVFPGFCDLPAATGGVDFVITDAFNLSSGGDQLLASCVTSTPQSQLIAWPVDAKEGVAQLVSWDWFQLGWVGYDHRTIIPVARNGATSLWIGTRPLYNGPTHQLFLVDPQLEGTEISGPASHPLTIEAPSRWADNNPTVQPRLADLDGNGELDLLATFPGDHDDNGTFETELWVLLNVDQVAAATPGAVLTRDDMDVVVTAGGSIDEVGDAFDVLTHDDGHVSVAVSAVRAGEGALAIISSFPLAAQTVSLESIADIVLDQPASGLAPFVFDVQDAGDLDGDGCRDLLVQTMEAGYYPNWGQGTAYVYAGD